MASRRARVPGLVIVGLALAPVAVSSLEWDLKSHPHDMHGTQSVLGECGLSTFEQESIHEIAREQTTAHLWTWGQSAFEARAGNSNILSGCLERLLNTTSYRI